MSGLIILGAGGHGKVVADIAIMIGKWDHIAFLDDNDELDEIAGLPIIGKLSDFKSHLGRYQNAFVAIGNNRLRLNWLYKLANAGFTVPIIIHPHSFVSKFSNIGEGSIVMAGAVVNACASIGRGCILNTCSSVDHDCFLQDGVHLSPGAHLGGGVEIGKGTWICMGSSIINNITVGSDAIVAAGATVIRNVPDRVMVAGVPANIKKHLELSL